MSDTTTDDNWGQIPGAEGTSFVEVSERSGDAEYAEQEDGIIAVEWLVVILVVLGFVVASAAFYGLYRLDLHRKETAKLTGLDLESPRSSTTHGSTNAASPTGATTTGDTRQYEQIEQGLLLQPWSDIPEEEEKTDEESQLGSGSDNTSGLDSHSKNACPICRKCFQTGEMVCRSKNDACKHVYHQSCMFNWLQYQTRCPVCNQDYLVPPPPVVE